MRRVAQTFCGDGQHVQCHDVALSYTGYRKFSKGLGPVVRKTFRLNGG